MSPMVRGWPVHGGAGGGTSKALPPMVCTDERDITSNQLNPCLLAFNCSTTVHCTVCTLLVQQSIQLVCASRVVL
jgi:hypothetical protein